jgi:hypothetical protein
MERVANRHVGSRWETPPISLCTIVARAEGYTYAARAWDLSFVQGAIFCRPRATLELRFATFAPVFFRCGTRNIPSHSPPRHAGARGSSGGARCISIRETSATPRSISREPPIWYVRRQWRASAGRCHLQPRRGVFDLFFILGPFPVAPCQTLPISRFATFSSL